MDKALTRLSELPSLQIPQILKGIGNIVDNFTVINYTILMKEINSSEDTNNDCLRTGQEERGMTVRKGKKLLQRVMRKLSWLWISSLS